MIRVRVGATALAAASVFAAPGCRPHHAADPANAPAPIAQDAARDATAKDAHVDAGTLSVAHVRFAPRWECRITGPGHVGRGPHVTVPVMSWRAPRGAIVDHVPMADGVRVIAREPVLGDAGQLVGGEARVVLRGGADAGHEIASRVIDVPDEALELLFEDAHRAGLALLEHEVLSVELVGASAADAGREIVARNVGDLTRACVGPVRDPIRFYPLAARPWTFPHVTGAPPLVANARWVISMDARGLCVARLEGEGPWGRAALDADADGTLHGELSLSESLNPVVCAPVSGDASAPR